MLRKSSASIAFPLIILVLVALTVSSFLFIESVDACHRRHRRPRPPPPAKWIKVTILCEETGVPVPDGLAVTIEGMGFKDTKYTKDGTVLFGSGLIDGTYTISWYWGEPYSYTVTINCSKITWEFEYTVPNPQIIKHFYYDAPYFKNAPVEGLKVTLLDGGAPVVTLETDETGTVVFDGRYVAVCHEYYLRWLWGGKEYIEGPIHFEYDKFGRLLELVWEGKNALEAKGGGGGIG
ncbi:MAG: hypothetical protein QXH20_00680 [Candidatus Bathyarchaeia archaeon]